MSDSEAKPEEKAKWRSMLKMLFDTSGDPVKHCDLYKDKSAGSCPHVDGLLCDFPECSMLKDYKARKAAAQRGGGGVNMNITVSCSRYNGPNAFCASIENEEDMESVTLSIEARSAKAACSEAAAKLRDLADRFDLLARERNPCHVDAHRRINEETQRGEGEKP